VNTTAPLATDRADTLWLFRRTSSTHPDRLEHVIKTATAVHSSRPEAGWLSRAGAAPLHDPDSYNATITRTDLTTLCVVPVPADEAAGRSVVAVVSVKHPRRHDTADTTKGLVAAYEPIVAQTAPPGGRRAGFTNGLRDHRNSTTS
jgi:hypothetical protein